MKPTIAVFDFADCNGCELQIGNCERELADLMGLVEVVHFRLVHTSNIPEEEGMYTIAFCQGSITTHEARRRLESIRARSTILIAMGACAMFGGVQGNVSAQTLESARQGAFGEYIKELGVFTPQPFSAFVTVDYMLPGCPIEKYEFLGAVATLLSGGKPRLPEYSVCTECRKRENPCIMLKGGLCLGMVTRGGCHARCPTVREGCRGCRGALPGANLSALVSILEARGLSPETVRSRVCTFNANALNDTNKECLK